MFQVSCALFENLLLGPVVCWKLGFFWLSMEDLLSLEVFGLEQVYFWSCTHTLQNRRTPLSSLPLLPV